ncbi:MAG: DeoR/GlpR family DNA-binding transcription regulator [Chania sp.]
MNSFERRNKIVDLIQQNGSILVSDLSNSFGISEVTIRADLRLLEEKGLLIRFHGGAARLGSPLEQEAEVAKSNDEIILEERYQMAQDPKKRIALKAVALVNPGDTVILDSGSTTMLIAEELVKMGNITVITNNLPAAFALSDNKDITLVLCGGTLRHKTRSLHGSIAELSLQGIAGDVMFVGADGLDATNGITTFNEGFSISSVMAQAAKRVVAVVDSTKFGRRGFNLVLPMSKIDIIITDTGINNDDHKALSQAKPELIIV